ncbi:MAG TPA: type IV toxin-antitoxin system AbiEi family antitoxin domain-containing protein [Candidatus Nanopelagicales bacterium]
MPARHRPHVIADVVRAHLGPDPVAVADVMALGVTPGQPRAAVAAGTLARLRRGFLTVGTVPGTGRSGADGPVGG